MTSLHKDERRLASAVGTLIFIVFGLLLWAAQFLVAYGVNTLACKVWQSQWWSGAAISTATIVAVAVMAAYVMHTERVASLFGLPLVTARREGLLTTGRVVALLATLAILWTGISMAFIDSCVQGR